MTNHAKQEAEIASAIEWCSMSRGHQTGRLLARLRDQLAESSAREQVARAEAWDEGVEAAFRGAVTRQNADNVKQRNPHRSVTEGADA